MKSKSKINKLTSKTAKERKKLEKLIKKDSKKKKVVKQAKEVIKLSRKRDKVIKKLVKKRSVTLKKIDDHAAATKESTSTAFPAADVVKMISTMNSADEIMGFVENDTRKTVLNRASAKIGSLKDNSKS